MNGPKTLVLLFFLSAFACTDVGKSDRTDQWTENQEIHFYNDCKEKMIANGEATEDAHAFCACCLLKLKDLFTDGEEAMQKLTDVQIASVEADCSR
ncbi:MAG: hypothetical protein KDB88_05035 [Flavobacteriales bacterium]|nr:hypothetical protein [Flavobacteriales bacterium]